jgi:hypothetical protein
MKSKIKIFTVLQKIPSVIHDFFKNLSDTGIFAFWMGGLFVAAALTWGLTAYPRAQILAAQANRVLEEIGESRRIQAPLPVWGLPGTVLQAGVWFVTGENNLAVVWNMFNDGICTPYVALFTSDTEIEKIVPLTRTAELIALYGSTGAPELWAQRIANAAQHIQDGR